MAKPNQNLLKVGDLVEFNRPDHKGGPFQGEISWVQSNLSKCEVVNHTVPVLNKDGIQFNCPIDVQPMDIITPGKLHFVKGDIF